MGYAAINVAGLFHAWRKQVVVGIGWHLVNRAVQLADDRLPDFTMCDRPPNMLQVRVNAYIYAALLDEAVLGSGATLALHTMLAGGTARRLLATRCGRRPADRQRWPAERSPHGGRELVDPVHERRKLRFEGCLLHR